jgi:hypothetical protein
MEPHQKPSFFQGTDRLFHQFGYTSADQNRRLEEAKPVESESTIARPEVNRSASTHSTITIEGPEILEEISASGGIDIPTNQYGFQSGIDVLLNADAFLQTQVESTELGARPKTYEHRTSSQSQEEEFDNKDFVIRSPQHQTQEGLSVYGSVGEHRPSMERQEGGQLETTRWPTNPQGTTNATSIPTHLQGQTATIGRPMYHQRQSVVEQERVQNQFYSLASPTSNERQRFRDYERDHKPIMSTVNDMNKARVVDEGGYPHRQMPTRIYEASVADELRGQDRYSLNPAFVSGHEFGRVEPWQTGAFKPTVNMHETGTAQGAWAPLCPVANGYLQVLESGKHEPITPQVPFANSYSQVVDKGDTQPITSEVVEKAISEHNVTQLPEIRAPTFQVALHGLRPTIRQHVIQHDPSSIEGIRKWGRITEMSQIDQNDTEKAYARPFKN